MKTSKAALITSSAFFLGLLFPVQAQDPLTNGLVAFYAFKGDPTDSSGHGNDGAVIGYDSRYGPDRFGQTNGLYLNTTSTPSATFDGTYVVAPRSGLLDFNGDFTLTAWVNIPTGLGGYYVHNLISNGPDQQVGAYAAGANLRLISDVGSNDYLQFICNHTNGDFQAFVETSAQYVVAGSGCPLRNQPEPVQERVSRHEFTHHRDPVQFPSHLDRQAFVPRLPNHMPKLIPARWRH